MAICDLLKEHKAYYTASAARVQLVDLPASAYASLTGEGDPNGALFAARVQALYTLVYTLKFRCKAGGRDFKVPKLEAQWWFDHQVYGHFPMAEAPQSVPREAWHYRLLIRLPDYLSGPDLLSAQHAAMDRKGLPCLAEVSWFDIPAIRAAQILHLGPFDREPETLLRLQQFLQKNNLVMAGPHHEIYLSDFRRTAPERLKTILREPLL